MSATIYLVRHGRTALNAQGRFRGRQNPPLDDQGYLDAAAPARALMGTGIEAVYASPLRRTMQTAEFVARAANARVHPEPDLIPSCGRELDPSDRSYEQKLILALSHRLPDRRLMAARILGQLRSRGAVPALERLALDGDDPYLQAEAARALQAIDPGNEVAARLAESGPILTRTARRPDAGR